MPPTPDSLDPADVDHVTRCITRALLDRNVLKGEVRKRDRQIERLKAELKIAHEFQGRLHEKCMALEQVKGSVLDGWDERFLLDHDCALYFKRLPNNRRRVVFERQGHARIVRNGKGEDTYLQGILEEASGRQRTRPAQEAA